ncbi:hypothetical protein KAU11_06730 [Candidatus Babeliales bacterium]|nr:hypothetical protein [Candidatus Babeliales bacterium]
MSSDIRITWNPENIRDFSHYLVYRDGTLVGKPTKETFLDRDVPNGTYDYTVVAVDEHGNESTASSPISKTSASTATTPADPSHLRYRLDNNNDVSLWWDHETPTGLTYQVWLKRDSDSYVLIDTTTSQSFLYREGVPEGSTYLFKVAAVSEDNVVSASYSNEVTVTIADTPTAPVLDSILFSLKSDFNINWTYPTTESKPNHYLIQKKKDSGSYITILKTTAQSATDYPFDVGTYTYRIYAVSDSGETSVASNEETLTISASTAVTLSSNIKDDLRSIKLSWTSVITEPMPSLFLIYRQTDSGNWGFIGKTTAYKFTDTDLSIATYNYKIFYISGWNVSSLTTVSSQSIVAYPAPSHVTGAASTLLDNGIAVTWEEAANAEYYQISVSIDGAASSIIGYPTSNKFFHDNLPSGHTYAYEILTVNSYGKLPTGTVPSGATTTSTITVPLEPKNLVASLRTDTLKMTFTMQSLEDRHKCFEVIRKSVGFTDTFPGSDPLNTYYWTNLSEILTDVDPAFTGEIQMKQDTTIVANNRYLTDRGDTDINYNDTNGYMTIGLTDPRDTSEIASDQTGSYIKIQTTATTINISYRKNWADPVVETPIAYTPGIHSIKFYWDNDTLHVILDNITILHLFISNSLPEIFLVPFIQCWYTAVGTDYLKVGSFTSTPDQYPHIITTTNKQTLSFPFLFPGGDYKIRNRHVLDEYQDSDPFPIDANSIIAPLINNVDREDGSENLKISYQLQDYFTQSSDKIEVWISRYATTGFSLLTTVPATGLAIPIRIPVSYRLSERDCYVYIKKISHFKITSQKSNIVNAAFPTMQSTPNVPTKLNLFLNVYNHYEVDWFFDKYNNYFEPLTRPPIAFKIYEDISGGGYAHIATTYDYKYILYLLPIGFTYSYKVKSIDNNGNESAFSTVVSIVV